MPKIDLASVPVKSGSTYPAPFDQEVAGRTSQRIGDAGGLTQFGANIIHLAPGAASSMQHWHERQDEALVVLTGTPTLIEETGETLLAPGDVATFKAGIANGHHLVNRTGTPASFFVVGTHTDTEVGHYTGRDLKVTNDGDTSIFTKNDGSPLD
ncbi:cupin domain-containing protein [Pseudaestuariivita sp.]|uniref:cupin domain-containing protein n=1 Tax=Pseudaestuariivita sp. TaxID=2211669 RepID=UPI004059BC27